MLSAAFLLIATASAPQVAPAAPAPRGIQVRALATAEVLSVARAVPQAGEGEPRRQKRRATNGQIYIEFE